jgi:hypothetical protein
MLSNARSMPFATVIKCYQMLTNVGLTPFNVIEWPLDNIKCYVMSTNVALNVDEC